MKTVYLSERNYCRTERKTEIEEEKKRYWVQLLGENAVEELLRRHPSFIYYLQNAEFEQTKEVCTDFFHIEDHSGDGEVCREIKGKKIFFAEFYRRFLDWGKEKLDQRMKKWEEYGEETIRKDFSDELLVRLQDIALRTLIAEMHFYKQRGEIQGKDSKEEYLDFCKISGTKEFYLRVSKTYPVLIRCMRECINKLLDYYELVLKWYREDRTKIENCFFEGEKPGGIVRIESGLSDLHNHGKEVMKVTLENGKTILLKPRSMRNEQFFSELLEWIGKRTGTDHYRYPILAFPDHSWCEIVEYRLCDSEEALHRYYRRLGEQLLLAYVLGTNDIHYENLIACGEYPVMIDLEAFTQNFNQNEGEKAEEAVKFWIKESVFSTGILPSYTWNGEGEGIDGSALHSRKGQKLPFKIPAVDQGETSEMRITYREGFSSEGKNIATTKEGKENLALYVEDLLRGFSYAYQMIEKEKEGFLEKIEKGKEIQSRIVLMHTQRYSMLLNSSYHPSLLMDGADREIFLSSIGQGRWEQNEPVVKEEVRALLNGDIPSFSFLIGGTDLLMGEGKKCSDRYFQHSAVEVIRARVKNLDERDRKKQSDLIRTSVELIPENRASYSNRIYRVQEFEEKRDCNAKGRIENQIAELTDRFCNFAVWNSKRTEVEWAALRFSGSGHYAWEIRPMGIYFYDGLSGLLLLATKISQSRCDRRVEEIRNALRRQIFCYTEKGLESAENLQSGSTGAYTGESSIVLVYLKLYQMTGESVYLSYAQKHAKLVAGLLPEDCGTDLLGGKAGAAWMFLQLYEVTKEEGYVEWAEQAIFALLPQAVKTECGIGWIPENCKIPVGGMAHGNAGILMPVLAIAEITGKKEYWMLAEQIWEYENSLYQEDTGNWADVREGDGEGEDTVAWCHGAAGILLARLWCMERVQDPRWKRRLQKDIERAYQKTEQYWKRDSWTLCHGNSGNLWILEWADWKLWKTDRHRGNYVDIHLLPQERMNPGMMGGYGGVLLYLMHCISKEKQEPTVLF